MHFKDVVPYYCCATDVFRSFGYFRTSLFDLFFLPPSLIRASDEVKLMNRDATLIGDEELPFALWTLSSLVPLCLTPLDTLALESASRTTS